MTAARATASMSWRARAAVGVVAGLAASVLAAGAAGLVAPASAHAATQPTDGYGAVVTSSAVTIHGRGEFAGMTFTVNQTKDLTNQALSVSWTGGTPTTLNGGKYATDFVQLMQCWGPAVTSGAAVNHQADNPGPARENCEYGANPPNPNSVPTADNAYAASRATAKSYESWNGLSPAYGAHAIGFVEIPFRAATGDTATQTDNVTGSGTPNNAFFDYTTTNEIDGAQTYGDQTGHVWFQADTAMQAPGLGCGGQASKVDPRPDDCWLVIVPRGQTEPDGKSLADDQQGYVFGSPLTPQAWANRVAIPLTFQPVTSTCPLGADERETTGSQLVASAMTSWQPVLCAHGPTFGYSSLADAQARSELSSGGARFVFTSAPVDTGGLPAGHTVDYAPIALSGVTIGFNIQQTDAASQGRQLTDLKLTPRLVAKLLTYSYRVNFPGAVTPNSVTVTPGMKTATGYGWLLKNPYTITQDPDFQQYNGTALQGLNINAGSLIVELGNLDAAKVLWQWVLADPAARAWLSGKPDPWGMVVDPYYATDAALDAGHVAFAPVDSFPVNDPWKNVLHGTGLDGHPAKSNPLTELDYHPYANDLASAAREARAANDGEKTNWTPGAAVGNGFSANGPQPQGQQFVMSVTDTVSAQQYGLQTASLSAAGDDGPDPMFVAPTTTSLLAGESAMKPVSTGSPVLWPVPTAGDGAYPLTMITYAATVTAGLTTAQCRDYAGLLHYAAGDGQVAGTSVGQLPLGYVPLPAPLRGQTTKAATQVARCMHPPSTAPTAATSVTTSEVPNPGRAPAVTAGTTTSAAASSASPAPSASSGPARVPLLLAAGTTPRDPRTFGAAVPVGLLVGLLAAVAAPALGRSGRRAALLLRAPLRPLLSTRLRRGG